MRRIVERNTPAARARSCAARKRRRRRGIASAAAADGTRVRCRTRAGPRRRSGARSAATCRTRAARARGVDVGQQPAAGPCSGARPRARVSAPSGHGLTAPAPAADAPSRPLTGGSPGPRPVRTLRIDGVADRGACLSAICSSRWYPSRLPMQWRLWRAPLKQLQPMDRFIRAPEELLSHREARGARGAQSLRQASSQASTAHVAQGQRPFAWAFSWRAMRPSTHGWAGASKWS